MVSLAGCESGTKPTQGIIRTTNAQDVLILKHPPKRHYVVLGVVRDAEIYHPEGFRSSILDVGGSPGVHTRLREKAAALGADAVIVTEEYFIDPSDESRTDSSRIVATGTAIRFTGEGQNTARDKAPPIAP